MTWARLFALTLLIAAASVALVLSALTEDPAPAPTEPAPAPVVARRVAPPPRPFGDVPEIEAAPATPAPDVHAPGMLALFAALTLKTVGVDGKALGNAHLSVRRANERGSLELDLGASGQTSFYVTPGTYFLRASSREGVGELEVAVKAGDLRATTLTLDRFDGDLEGDVVDDLGVPVHGATVRVGYHSADLPLGGHFRIPVFARDVVVTAEAPGYVTVSRKVTMPTEPVRLVMGRACSMRVRVTDEAGEDVAASVDVSTAAYHAQIDRMRPGPIWVPCGVVQVRALRLFGGWLQRATKEVPLPGGPTVDVDLTVKRATGIEGRVVDAKGFPVREVRVVALDAASNPRRSVTVFERQVMSAQTTPYDAVGFTDADGRFNLEPLRVDRVDTQYRIQVLGAGLREPEKPTFQELGGPPVQIVLEPRHD